MRNLTLNDGTMLDGKAIRDGDVLWVYLDGTKMADAYPELSAEEKTEKITANEYGEITEYTGFTYLFSMREEMSGTLSAGLRREVNANV